MENQSNVNEVGRNDDSHEELTNGGNISESELTQTRCESCQGGSNENNNSDGLNDDKKQTQRQSSVRVSEPISAHDSWKTAIGFAELQDFCGPFTKLAQIREASRVYDKEIKFLSTDAPVRDRDGKIVLFGYLKLLLETRGKACESCFSNELVDNFKQRHVSVETKTTDFYHYCMVYGSDAALVFAQENDMPSEYSMLESIMRQETNQEINKWQSNFSADDPMRTFLELLSRQQPRICTKISTPEQVREDWTVHLATILGQRTTPKLFHLVNRSLVAMGDTFASTGYTYSAHFCYLLSGCGIGNYDEPNAKIVLIGADHLNLPVELYSTNKCIQWTEIYEYSRCMFTPKCKPLPELLYFKIRYMHRLADARLLKASLSYFQAIVKAFAELQEDAIPLTLFRDAINWANYFLYIKQIDPVTHAQYINQLQAMIREREGPSPELRSGSDQKESSDQARAASPTSQDDYDAFVKSPVQKLYEKLENIDLKKN